MTDLPHDCSNDLCAMCDQFMPENDRHCCRPSFCTFEDKYANWGYVNVHAKCANDRDAAIDEYYKRYSQSR